MKYTLTDRTKELHRYGGLFTFLDIIDAGEHTRPPLSQYAQLLSQLLLGHNKGPRHRARAKGVRYTEVYQLQRDILALKGLEPTITQILVHFDILTYRYRELAVCSPKKISESRSLHCHIYHTCKHIGKTIPFDECE